MSLNLISNTSANTTLRLLKGTEKEMSHLMGQIASGYRVRVSSDDAAEMAIGTALKAEVVGLTQASDNIAVGLNMLQTADSAYGVIADILIRLEDLAMQSATDSIGSAGRTKLDLEYQQLLVEIDRLSDITNYNSTVLLGGSTAELDSTTVFDFRVGTGVIPAASNPDIVNDIMVTLLNVNQTTLGLANTNVHDADGDPLNTNAKDALTALQGASGSLATVENARATIGAYMNRLSLAGTVIDISRENAEASRSTLMDADIPTVLAQLAAQSVLMEAGFSMLASSNRIPQSIVGLLHKM